MNKTERTALKKHIFTEIDTLRDDITSLKKLVQPIAPDNAVGRLSRMEAIGTKSINEATLSKALLKLEKLKAVLTDIKNDDPDFGICIECGETIPARRIILMPESRMCVQCAGNLE